MPAEPDDGGTPSEYGVPKLRQLVLQRLADAYAYDNLELAEYERRVRVAEHAATIAQLEALVADFPDAGRAPQRAPTAALAGGGTVVTVMGDRELRVQAVDDLPRQAINVMGATHLDLSDVPPGVYELRVFNTLGELNISVPYGTRINRTLWGMLSNVSIRPRKGKRPARTRFTSHLVTIAGVSLLGEVVIREEFSP